LEEIGGVIGEMLRGETPRPPTSAAAAPVPANAAGRAKRTRGAAGRAKPRMEAI